jgi:hypothetical protein
MKKILLLCLAIGMASSTSLFANITFCLTNDFGEQTTLWVTGRTGTTIWLEGEIDYSVFGSTIWPCKGSFDISTRTLAYTATNPNPDNCTMFATTVDFSYTWVSGLYGYGTFSNDCGNFGSLGASASKGACPFDAIAMKKGEYGSTGSHKMFRTKLPLPKGESLEEILSLNVISVTPNPVSKAANISVTLAASSKISINIYNRQGALVYTVANEFANAGKHNYTWNLQTKNTGTAKSDYYIVKLVTKNGEQSAQILVTR